MLRRAERLVVLNVLDAAWRDHLYEMDYLREGVGLRAMGQRDPLVEYRREGFELFENLKGRIRDEFTRYIFHVSAVEEGDRTQRRPAQFRYTAPAKTQDAADSQRKQQQRSAGRGAAGAAAAPAAPMQAAGDRPPRAERRRGRRRLRDGQAREATRSDATTRVRAARARSTSGVTASTELGRLRRWTTVGPS